MIVVLEQGVPLGRSDLLVNRADADPVKTKNMDLSFITGVPSTKEDRSWVHTQKEPAHSTGSVLDDDILARTRRVISR